MNKILFIFIFILLLFIDQISKFLAFKYLFENEKSFAFFNTLFLKYAENEGTIYSIGDNLPDTLKFILLFLIPLIFVCIAFVYFFKYQFSLTKDITFLLFFSGGIGNLIDRLIHGYVIDFLIIDFKVFNTAIFNIADVFLIFSLFLYIFSYFRKS
tara:strand:- start:4287 stop:4751 length:465 start_codon:yes stop_codon:yes gene_type:complete